jgi:hypothetical protein
MTRERWFYAEGRRRMGPVTRQELIEALLQLTDPRACLIWRRGLQTWMPAAEVPEIDRLLAPAPEPARPATATPTPRAPRAAPAPPARGETRGSRLQGPALYVGGVAVALLVIGAVVWLRWPRSEPKASPGADLQAPPVASAPSGPAGDAVPSSSPGAAPTAAPGPAGAPGFAGWADQEADLPNAELRLLRGVGAWAGDKLTITLYNGSSWRVTEIFVRTSGIQGDRFVDADAPRRLLPAGVPVDAAVGELLKKVAPDRKRPGVNPADTGAFEGVVGPQPAAYRWKIEGARGYPPRAGR